MHFFSFPVYHDFFTAFGKTKIFVQKKNEGYGLMCHRAIKEICQAIGIKDLRAKVEGSNNLQHIVKAFFIGLLQQVDNQMMIDYYTIFSTRDDYYINLNLSREHTNSWLRKRNCI